MVSEEFPEIVAAQLDPGRWRAPVLAVPRVELPERLAVIAFRIDGAAPNGEMMEELERQGIKRL